MTNASFELVGQRAEEAKKITMKKKWHRGKPVLSMGILLVIVLGCLFAEILMTKDPS